MPVATGRFGVVTLTPVITATPDYSAGDAIGTANPYTLANVALESGVPVRITNVVVKDKGAQSPQFTVYLFKTAPSGGTYTDNGALALHANDWAKYVGKFSIATADWKVVSSMGFADKAVNTVVELAGTSLFAIIVADAIWNAGSVSDLELTINLERI